MSDMICSRLRELRRKNGYTQSGLAKALGVSQSTVGNWEAGIRMPNLDTLERITRLFGISVGCFFGEQEIKTELEQVKRERDTALSEICSKCERDYLQEKGTMFCSECCHAGSNRFCRKALLSYTWSRRNPHGKTVCRASGI